MVVAFVTFNETAGAGAPQAWLTSTSADPSQEGGPLPRLFDGITRVYVDPSPGARTYYMHFVKLSGLVPRQRYTYQVRSGGSDWSSPRSFKALYSGGRDYDPAAHPTRFAIYGDHPS